MTNNTPGTYEKDGQVRLARSPRVAVTLTFEGFKRTGDLPADTDTVDADKASDTAQPVAVTPGKPAKPAAKPNTQN